MSIEIAPAIAIDTPNEPTVYRFGEAVVTLSASSPGVLGALQEILVPSVHDREETHSKTSGAARSASDGWHLEVDGKAVRGLSLSTPLPKVAEELISAVSAAVAGKSNDILINGALLSKGNATLAIVGDDSDSGKVLAFHLLARGWAAIAFGSSFLKDSTLEVVALQALASVSSSSIDQIPPRYRAAVEKSRWYDAGYDLIFYTVDPLDTHRQKQASGTLSHVLIVDGDLDQEPILSTDVSSTEIGSIGHHSLVGALRLARLTIGTPIASCDLIEQWISGPPA